MNKTKVIPVRFSEKDWKKITEHAKEQMIPNSMLIRNIVMKSLEKKNGK